METTESEEARAFRRDSVDDPENPVCGEPPAPSTDRLIFSNDQLPRSTLLVEGDGSHFSGRQVGDVEGCPSPIDSSSSGYTLNSQYEFLRGKTEKDEYVQQRLAEDMSEDSKQRECGIGHFRPSCLQPCADIRMFIFVTSMLIAVSTGLSAGYFNSVITTIEKRFEIGSSTSGLIAASYEFGSLVAVVFVSYLGGRRHIPKWIGLGVVCMGIGALLFALPHIMAEKYTKRGGIDLNSTEENICSRLSGSARLDEAFCVDEHSGNFVYVLILVVAQVLIGTGGTPIMTLGTTYVDDHVPKEKAPAYLAFIYAMGALGPVLGFTLGALLLQYYVDLFSYDVNLTPSDPRWVGAWWGGFIICGGLLLMLSVPFLAFPKKLIKEQRKLLDLKVKEDLLKPADHEANEEFGKTIKDIPKSILALMKNRVYFVLCLGICCEISVTSGFVVFIPKYLETQFGVSKSQANLFTGGVGIPGAVLGIMVGGYVLKRFQLRPKGAIQMILALNLISLAGFSVFFFLGCDNLKLAGATEPYVRHLSNVSVYSLPKTNLTSSCNLDCDCSSNEFELICGVNGITYFSPCHAGCTRYYESVVQHERLLNYTGCSCISDEPVSPEVIMSPLATNGPCKTTCDSMLPFLILLVVMTFCVSGTHMPLVMVTLRSVAEEERAFALGMQFVILRLFANIPAPIMFGNIIDTTCMLWKQKCENVGACFFYDIVQFRYKYVGISAALNALGCGLFFVVWLLIKQRYTQEGPGAMANMSDLVASMSSIDRLDLSKPIFSPQKTPLSPTSLTLEVNPMTSGDSVDTTSRGDNPDVYSTTPI
ncbi:solute carrier organic anion transporter family member 5A1-like [Liolophura sinensis]|uniref:solute carrier organic anion transporter family member 5A1-like n=1 Tax=Liolophura sinensis TaxID=3198878 RepID=UPI0031597D44